MPILFIDCYDSFTYNLVHLVNDVVDEPVVVVHNDSISKQELYELIPCLDAIIVGPGPGHPANDKDAGVIKYLWDLPADLALPIFGVCFGFQSMALAFGGSVDRLPHPQHGQYGTVAHQDSSIFKGLPQDYKVIRYHSLYADIKGVEQLTPLAYADDVLMGLQHVTLPWYGVQFHPESVLSEHGAELIANFWRAATEYNRANRKLVADSGKLKSSALKTEPLVPALGADLPAPPAVKEIGHSDPVAICEFLNTNGTEFVMLHSAAHPGNWTIIGVLDKDTPHLRCKRDKTFIGPLHGSADALDGDYWAHVAEFMAPKLIDPSQVDKSLPFVGGLVGYVTYEKASGHEWDKSIDQANSDASFVFVDRCILVNDRSTYLVGPQHWISSFASSLAPVTVAKPSIPKATIILPNKEKYLEDIGKCQEYLHSGDSYELCLTAQTRATFDTPVAAWDLYKHLLSLNPAPYTAFLNFDDSLVGTSPERFMSWSRDGVCQFRPIKGTVRKAPGVTRADADAILGTDKERAENLMIVDLIRHDLGHLLNKVECPLLMSVEEYKTVFQLVSVIEGQLKNTPYSGLDVLRHSLPPGSMTGAPKIRSVEILRSLEQQPRGLYSGVCGYWSITDEGDWSVVIRSAFKYARDDRTWRLGAGGAITVLSDSNAEFEEMETKLDSTIRAFQSS